MEAKDAGKCPTVHRAAPMAEPSGPDVSDGRSGGPALGRCTGSDEMEKVPALIKSALQGEKTDSKLVNE